MINAFIMLVTVAHLTSLSTCHLQDQKARINDGIVFTF
jgi:hypothetical protein